jgi:hypothetical protein
VRTGGDDRAACATPVQLAGGSDAALDEVGTLLVHVLVGASVQQGLDLTHVRADQVGAGREGRTEHSRGGVDEHGHTAGVADRDDLGVEGGRHVRRQRPGAQDGGRLGQLHLLGDRGEQRVVVPLVRLGAPAVHDGHASGILEEDEREASRAAVRHREEVAALGGEQLGEPGVRSGGEADESGAVTEFPERAAGVDALAAGGDLGARRAAHRARHQGGQPGGDVDARVRCHDDHGASLPRRQRCQPLRHPCSDAHLRLR